MANRALSARLVGAGGVKKTGYASKISAYKRTENTNMQPTRQCYRCNGSHAHQHCKFKDAICHFCKKAGHIAAASRKKQGTLSETHAVYTAPAHKEEYSLYNVDNINKSSTQQQPITVKVKMNGKDISMVVDTGAGVSIINELTMQTVVTDNPTKLQPCHHKHTQRAVLLHQITIWSVGGTIYLPENTGMCARWHTACVYLSR